MSVTPRPLLASVVSMVCGEAGEPTRLTAGGLNETYRVDFANRSPVVVRIARRPEPWFTNEAPAINRARLAGIPAPEVLDVEHVEHDDELLSFSILEMLPGQPLDEIAGDLPPDELERIVNSAGELLAQLRSFDPSSAEPVGEAPLAPHTLALPSDAVVDRAVRAATNAVGPDAGAAVEHGVELFAAQLGAANAEVHVVTHGDWLPKHFMISEQEIVGVIDWEFASAARAAIDLAHWEVAAGPLLRDRSDWLRAGYARVADVDTASELALPYVLHYALDVLGWQNPASPERQRHCVEVISRAMSGG